MPTALTFMSRTNITFEWFKQVKYLFVSICFNKQLKFHAQLSFLANNVDLGKGISMSRVYIIRNPVNNFILTKYYFIHFKLLVMCKLNF